MRLIQQFRKVILDLIHDYFLQTDQARQKPSMEASFVSKKHMRKILQSLYESSWASLQKLLKSKDLVNCQSLPFFLGDGSNEGGAGILSFELLGAAVVVFDAGALQLVALLGRVPLHGVHRQQEVSPLKQNSTGLKARH